MKTLFITILSFSFLISFEFKSKPIKLNKNSYYFQGKKQYFSKKNAGNISNSAFIITKHHVILIDTGSTFAYAQYIKKEIKKITKKPIKYIFNTHHHPDHFLGNNAFKEVDIYAGEYTAKEIKVNGQLYVNNIINQLGSISDLTKAKTPNKILNKNHLLLDNYELEILFCNGHTKEDIVIFDKNSKILYVSDLIFNKRALATPHADIEKWIKSLKKLKKLDFKILVPGHGKAEYNKNVIDENIAYLDYLHKTLIHGIQNGLEVFEILAMNHPKKFRDYSIFNEEFERSIINLYPKYERKY